MTHLIPLARFGLTALAAVLAASSTPALAQDAQPAATTPEAAPVTVVAPPPVVSAPAPAIATTPTDAAAATTAAPTAIPAMATRSTPIYHVEEASDPAPAPAPRTVRAPSRPASAVRTAPAPTQASTTAPRAASLARAPQPVPPPQSVAAELPAAPARQPVQPSLATRQQMGLTDRQEVEIAGGLALLLLGGATGIAAARRRRRAEADLVIEEAPTMQTAAEPVLAREPAAPPAPRRTPFRRPALGGQSELPAGFDLSRFGPHVQAAYRGPTSDNPSLSLKKRLHRAAALDQRERMARENGEQIVRRPAPSRGGLFRPGWSLQGQG